MKANHPPRWFRWSVKALIFAARIVLPVWDFVSRPFEQKKDKQ